MTVGDSVSLSSPSGTTQIDSLETTNHCVAGVPSSETSVQLASQR